MVSCSELNCRVTYNNNPNKEAIHSSKYCLQIDNLEPMVVDLWVEAVGSPLQFAVNLGLDISPVLWVSTSDPERALKVTNTSRADLAVQACVMQEHGHHHDALPFRVYIRFYDIPPRTCPCVYTLRSNSVSVEETNTSIPEEMDTAIELFLIADFGIQSEAHYLIEPVETVVPSASNVSWTVRLRPTPDPVPPCVLLLRVKPVHESGHCWFRPAPPPRRVLLQHAPRCPRLRLSCNEVPVAVCALDLPVERVMRIRKSIQVHNVGDGVLHVALSVTSPWRVAAAGASCRRGPRGRPDVTQLHVPPRGTVELCTEVSLHTRDVWPAPGETYESQRITTTQLYFRDENQITLWSLPLILEIDLPVIQAKPSNLDFGFITDGDTRKNYITVTHSSCTATVDLVTKMEGSHDFQVWPPGVVLEPGASEIIYVQYTARWRSSPAAGTLVVAAACGAGAWCAATVAVRATPTRDHMYRDPPHDYTDDMHSLSP